MTANDWLIEGSKLEDRYPVSVAGSSTCLTREQVDLLRAALTVEPGLRDRFRRMCARQGQDEKAVLEDLIAGWLNAQTAAPEPATTIAG